MVSSSSKHYSFLLALMVVRSLVSCAGGRRRDHGTSLRLHNEDKVATACRQFRKPGKDNDKDQDAEIETTEK